ncbi:DUF2971 domain-containing protein [Aeromonas veronii]
MFTFQKESTKYIYHYTKADVALDFILKNSNLRLSKFNATNDPKESKDWFFIPGTNEGRCLDKYTPEYLSKKMNPDLKEKTSLICFTKDKILSGNHLEDMPLRGFCKPRMWAQYAANHSGVCLIFDESLFSKFFHEQFNDKTYSCRDVIYCDRKISDVAMEQAFIVNVDHLERRGDDYVFDHLMKFQNRLFFEKASDWSSEDEYRFVIFDCLEQLYFNYKTSLKGIVFGENCSNDMIREIVQSTKMLGLQYQKLSWRNCAPWLDFARDFRC